MYFMPCFFCNVSDAWLIKEKSKRLWVTLAGAWCDLCVWAMAMLVWRMTIQNSLLNYLAWVVLSICGIRIFFNFNPLLKLDGYYLLSDWVSIPNLRQRSWDAVGARLRALLWGAAWPQREQRSGFLIAFGIATWVYSAFILSLMLLWLFHVLSKSWGIVGAVVVLVLAIRIVPALFTGFFRGEFKQMLSLRQHRVAVWLIILCGIVAALFFLPMEQRACGNFKLRPRNRAEVRAPVAGFLREVKFDEGDSVRGGAVLGLMEVPDLASRIAQKQADIEAAAAKLKLLQVGARHEELLEAHRNIQRLSEWRDLAEQDLDRARLALKSEMRQLDELLRQDRIEIDYAQTTFLRTRDAFDRNAMSQQEFDDARKKYECAEVLMEQHKAQQQQKKEMGTTIFEAELARRSRQLADGKSVLTLLEAGSRPEEIAAQQAVLNALREELKYLDQLKDKSPIRSACAGRIVTPHLAEKVGQYFKEGELLFVVEDASVLDAEISLPEQEALRVRGGQPVELKLPAAPYQIYRGQVRQIAPSAAPGDVRSSLTVYCALPQLPDELRSGMSGYARVCCGKQPMGIVLGDRVMRSIRTDFWW
jgi:multidrug efflux pump subunit AcrA (membrane-fusion protein)